MSQPLPRLPALARLPNARAVRRTTAPRVQVIPLYRSPWRRVAALLGLPL